MNTVKYYKELFPGKVEVKRIRCTGHYQRPGDQRRTRPYVAEADAHMRKQGYSRTKPKGAQL